MEMMTMAARAGFGTLPHISLTLQSEKDIFLDVCAYIEKLFLLVQPDQLLFIAIDGVAPRAKMNQQRQRRYRKVLASEATAKKRADAGAPAPASDKIFDSNCISPGTEFMQRAAEAIQYFIKQKIRDDLAWQRINIVFSGSEVPGEGEHKIAQYIREMRAKPEYNSQTSHCVYGLDADLIMLGLATQERHMSIIREKVMLGHGRHRDDAPPVQFFATRDFEFLHILLFVGTKDATPEQLRSIIDDFVFLCFLVGNDFIPCAPGLGIDEGGLAFLVQMYKEFRPKLLAQFPDKPFIMNSRDVTLNGRAFAAFVGLLQPQENKYLNDYFTEESIKERMEAAKAKAAAALAPSAPAAAVVNAAGEAKEEKKEAAASAVKSEEKASEAVVAKPPPATSVPLPSALLGLTPKSPLPTPASSSGYAAALAKAAPLKAKEEMAPLASFVGKDDAGLSGIASSGLTLEPNAAPAAKDGKKSVAPIPEGLVLPRGRTVAVANIPRGATSAQLSALLVKYGPIARIELGPASADPQALQVALATFETNEAAASAVVATSALAIDGAQLVLTMSMPVEPKKTLAAIVASSATAPAAAPTPAVTAAPATPAAAASVATLTLRQMVENMKATEECKDNFYKHKIAYSAPPSAQGTPVSLMKAQLTHAYIECLHWCMFYYYHGPPSWATFYPFFFAPLLSDLREVFSKTIASNGSYPTPDWHSATASLRGEPLLPVQQLAAILPPQSAALLPTPYRHLLTDSKSPVADFYPLLASVGLTDEDRNRDWHRQLLLPFVDATRLAAACTAVPESSLSAAEVHRNKMGPSVFYNYSPKVKADVPSPAFAPFLPPLTAVPFASRLQQKGELHGVPPPGAQILFAPYLPSLRGSVVFNSYLAPGSRSESLVLSVEQPWGERAPNLEELAAGLVGRACAVGWPYLNLAQITMVMTEKFTLSTSKRGKPQRTDTPGDQWQKLCIDLKAGYLAEKKIDLGETVVILHVVDLQGTSLSQESTAGDKATFQLTRVHSQDTVPVPLQLAVPQAPALEERFRERKLEMPFAVAANTPVVLLGPGPNYGALGRVRVAVTGSETAEVVVSIRAKDFAANPLTTSAFNGSLYERYRPANEVSKILQVSGLTLARITSNLYFAAPLDVDLGLCFKYSRKRVALPGYARLVFGQDRRESWEYSWAAIELLKDYKAKFPQIFAAIETNPDHDALDPLAVFGPEWASLGSAAVAWKKEKGIANQGASLVPADAASVSPISIAGIERIQLQAALANPQNSTVKVHPGYLCRQAFSTAIPITACLQNPSGAKVAQFTLGDRVANVSFSGVPFGLSGTVVTLFQNMAEVVFDQEFLGATLLNGRLTTRRGMVLPVAALINLSNRPRHPLDAFLAESKPVEKAQANQKGAKNKFALLDADS